MILRYPEYFDQFCCIAGSCPDSCCKEWDVLVDEASAEAYLAMEGELGAALRENMYQEDGAYWFSVTDGRCPFWRTDGLCRIQAEKGHEMLCQTCRDFPRLTHDYGDFVEKGLSLSCPEAAKWILSDKNGTWITEEVPGGEPPEYDKIDMETLLQTRQRALELLSDPTLSVQEALAATLLYGYQAQAELDGEEPAAFDVAAELALARSLAKPADGMALREFYSGLEILTAAWKEKLAHSQGDDHWDGGLLAMARYGICRYWLQAISDFDLVGRVKLVLWGCVLVQQLGGDLLQTAQLYSKEIENDDENIDAILEGAYASPALTDEKLLGMLLMPL